MISSAGSRYSTPMGTKFHLPGGVAAAALFAGLTSLPKDTALSTYSCKLEHARQVALLQALDTAAIAAGLVDGEVFNLDFHAILHWGNDVALEKNYVPRRSQRTRCVLTFFAEDAARHTLVYANADLSKATQAGEVLAFCDHWHAVTGHDPTLHIMDSKVTTQEELGKLPQRGIGFITLRASTPTLTRALAAQPKDAWATITLDRAGGKTRRVQVLDNPTVSDYPGTLRQLAVDGLGREEPTILITNGLGPLHDATPKKIIEH
jgi:hypothetical protein